ncbi:hypothetical protein FRB99_006836 [Tulasnella sp. 403]|nr:hypothetical protein FRB99_006836 [Tulasnella sp. 403]
MASNWVYYDLSVPEGYNGSTAPPGEEVPTSFDSFFDVSDDDEPPTPTLWVKNFFGKNRKSDPGNGFGGLTRARSKSNPLDGISRTKYTLSCLGPVSCVPVFTATPEVDEPEVLEPELPAPPVVRVTPWMADEPKEIVRRGVHKAPTVSLTTPLIQTPPRRRKSGADLQRRSPRKYSTSPKKLRKEIGTRAPFGDATNTASSPPPAGIVQGSHRIRSRTLDKLENKPFDHGQSESLNGSVQVSLAASISPAFPQLETSVDASQVRFFRAPKPEGMSLPPVESVDFGGINMPPPPCGSDIPNPASGQSPPPLPTIWARSSLILDKDLDEGEPQAPHHEGLGGLSVNNSLGVRVSLIPGQVYSKESRSRTPNLDDAGDMSGWWSLEGQYYDASFGGSPERWSTSVNGPCSAD